MSSDVSAFEVSMLSKASLAAAIALSETYGDVSVFSVVVLATVVSATVVLAIAVLSTIAFSVARVAVLLVSAETASVVVFRGCTSSA